MPKYIKLKRHTRVVAFYETQLNHLRTIVDAQSKEISGHALELRREVANARHGTLSEYVESVNESLRQKPGSLELAEDREPRA